MIADPAAAAGMYWVPRHNIIFGKVILHAGWYPDYQPRLFRRGVARLDPARVVHELPLPGLAPGTWQAPLTHYNYETVGEFLSKQMHYADLDVERLLRGGRAASILGAAGPAAAAVPVALLRAGGLPRRRPRPAALAAHGLLD